MLDHGFSIGGRGTYLGEKVVSEKEYLSAMLANIDG